MLSEISSTVKQTLSSCVLANLLPMGLVFLSSWTLFQHVLVYWLETLIVVLIGIVRVMVVEYRRGERGLGLATTLVLVLGPVLGYAVLTWVLIANMFQMPLVPYGWMVSGSADFLTSLDLAADGWIVIRSSMVLACLALLGAHIHTFVVHVLPQKDTNIKTGTEEFIQFSMHGSSRLLLIVGMSLVADLHFLEALYFQMPFLALTGFVILKTVIEIRTHLMMYRLLPGA